MSYFLIIIVALFVSMLTFFSGFGLGTLLMPAFAVFFPLDIAVAATAIVHLANNIFKLMLVGKNIHFKTILVFGVPAVFFAFLGAYLLTHLSDLAPLYSYVLLGKKIEIELIKVVVAVLLMFFAMFELLKKFREMSFSRKYLVIGGALSGFFGGLSGQQGALRSAFLVKVGLNKQQFIASSVMVAVMVDVSRLLIYGIYFFDYELFNIEDKSIVYLIIAGTFAAFVGSFTGNKLLKKITMKTIQLFVGVLLLIVALLLALGII